MGWLLAAVAVAGYAAVQLLRHRQRADPGEDHCDRVGQQAAGGALSVPEQLHRRVAGDRHGGQQPADGGGRF